MKRKIFLIAPLMILLQACDDHLPLSPITHFILVFDQHVKVPPQAYLPLEVGNYWELAPPDATSWDDGIVKTEVVGTTVVGSALYYKLITNRIEKTSNLWDTTYYRVDAEGNFYSMKHIPAVGENNPMRINAVVDERWLYSWWEPNGIQVTALGTTNPGEATWSKNSKGFMYDDPALRDDQTYVFFTPKIGFSAEIKGTGKYKQLRRAIVGGKTYTF